VAQNSINNSASSLDVDNLNIDGNTISSTNTNGDINISPNGTGNINTGTPSTNNLISMNRSSKGQWIKMNDQTDDFGIFNSTGSPESVVSADTGSICTDTDNGVVYVKQTDGANTGWKEAGGHSGSVIQVTESTNTTGASTLAIIPFTNSIPQITQGASFMTHVHTPIDTSNILKIEFSTYASCNFQIGAPVLTTAIFQRPTSDALVAIPLGGLPASAIGIAVYVPFYIYTSKTAGTTSPITFEVRFGTSSTSHSVGLNASKNGSHSYSTAGKAILRVTEYSQ
jgi:hypothetical protein